MPYVGFIIPVYNTHPNILKRTLDDLIKKTILPIFVVDDNSTKEDTKKVLKEYEKTKQIEVIHHERNLGKIEALYTGIKHSNLTYAFFIDDDVSIEVNQKDNLNQLSLLDKIIIEETYKLSSDSPVIVYPVGARNKEKNLLTRIQHIEHLIPTYIMRKFLEDGIYVGGTGSLWISNEFSNVYYLHTKSHLADDLETSLILYRMNKQILFSDRLILLADMKDTFISWFKQRLIWEYGKWRLLKRYYTEIINNPNTLVYYFTSPVFFLSTLINPTITFGYISLLSLPIIKKKRNLYNNSIEKKLKEIYIYVPILGLLSLFFPHTLLFAPFYYYYPIKKEKRENNIIKKEDFHISNLYLLTGYSIFYLTVIQPLGILYALYKKFKK
mgnify:CR=1 FL=1